MMMPFIPRVMMAVGITLVPAWLASDAHAGEIRLLSAAVMKPVLTVLTGDFERATEHRLSIAYAPAAAVKRRVEANEMIDLAIIQRTAAEELVLAGKIETTGMVTLARSGLAVAIRRGMTKPDIATTEAFKKALLAAKSISYPDPAKGHAAGILFRAIIERLGIAHQIAAKAKLQTHPFSESPPEDQADLGIAQMSEILITSGYEPVDLIPENLQKYDQFSWTVAVSTNAREPNGAAALIRFLCSARAALVMRSKGMEPGAL